MRATIPRIVTGFLHPKILLPIALLAVLVTGAVLGAMHISLWTWALLRGTIVWFLASGLTRLFKLADASKEGFVRRRARSALTAAVIVEFYVGLVSFSLGWELAIQIVATFLSVLAVTSTLDERHRPIARFAQACLVLLGIALVVATAFELPSALETQSWADIGRSFALPLWLGAVALAYMTLFAAHANYEVAFLRMKLAARPDPVGWRPRMALIADLGLRNPEIREFGGAWVRELVAAPSWSTATAKVRQYRDWRQAGIDAKRVEAEALVRFAGVEGIDDHGRQLDRREFAETIGALEWLSTCHMGWHRKPQPTRYDADLLRIFQPGHTRGLPDDHGIVMEVSDDGQRWFAWRRTITGWVFAIGADGPPPIQWFHDGREPPIGHPGESPEWGDSPFERSPNWDAAG